MEYPPLQNIQAQYSVKNQLNAWVMNKFHTVTITVVQNMLMKLTIRTALTVAIPNKARTA